MPITPAVAVDPSAPSLSRKLVFAMAAACGIAVANIYYNQPMLGLIEHDFGSSSLTGMIPTSTQLGYAFGLFTLVPLGDIVNRRRLIVGQFLVLCLALVLAALSPTAAVLLVASFAVGATSTVAQQIVPLAAALATPEKRGATIGTVMSGLLSGILLSRTLAGFVGSHAGWRDMFLIALPMALAAAGVMWVALPRMHEKTTLKYGTALVSLVHIWREERQLRFAAVKQALLFASFSAFWTILALHLEEPSFHLGAEIAGLFGVIGAVGVFAAPVAGRVADRYGPEVVITTGAILSVASWAIFGFWSSLIGLVVGVVLLDFAMQSALVSHQHIVFSLRPAARSRLNTIFMTCMFIGGAVGSAGATFAWSSGGWNGVSYFGAGIAGLALVIELSRFLQRDTAVINKETQ